MVHGSSRPMLYAVTAYGAVRTEQRSHRPVLELAPQVPQRHIHRVEYEGVLGKLGAQGRPQLSGRAGFGGREPGAQAFQRRPHGGEFGVVARDAEGRSFADSDLSVVLDGDDESRYGIEAVICHAPCVALA
jgi:hypothetical protein